MIVASVVKPNFYQDSLSLLRLARELKERTHVGEVTVLMGTPANKQLLAGAGLLTPEGDRAEPNDLVIAVRATSAAEAQSVLAQADVVLTERRAALDVVSRGCPRTLDSALRQLPSANVALISVPGAWAGREARRALRHGLHTMLFSDNVPLEEEIALKREALAAGCLLMGPDCGTAILNGVALGFANAIPRGAIGLVASSGTGLQQVMTLLARLGEGVTHAIGVGGRDGSAAVEGLMTLAALDVLAADPSTETVVIIGKPPAPDVYARIDARVREIGKPCVLGLLGGGAAIGQVGPVTTVATLEDAAHAAAALRRGRAWAPVTFTIPDPAIEAHVRRLRGRLSAGRERILGLYAGGTLAHEARMILEPVARAEILDLGADEHTVGRLHPMLDSSLRVEKINEAARATDLAVLLLDVVLGYGVAPDPAGDLFDAIATVSRSVAVVASVIGTPDDPQGHAAQVDRLQNAGAWVLPSNAQAARAAAVLVGHVPRSSSVPAGRPPGASASGPAGSRSAPSRHTFRVAELLRSKVSVVNVGLEAFAVDLARRDVAVVHVAWRPPGGGDPRLGRLLAQLDGL
jgi:FdrA protein